MKKIVKQISKEIIQVTMPDERWYIKTDENGIDTYVPSVTWITSHYPKGIGFYKWIASKGWDEAETIKSAAGDKGSKVHTAIGKLIDGDIISMESKITNPSTGAEEELSTEEYEAIMSFVSWYTENKPKIYLREHVVFDDDFGYAGTVDCICKIKEKLFIIDFKTSQEIWPSFEIQLSAYKQALLGKFLLDPTEGKSIPVDESINLAVLQIGYGRNKKGYKFTEIEDNFSLFLAARTIWQKESSNQRPFQRDYPTFLVLPIEKPAEILETLEDATREKLSE